MGEETEHLQGSDAIEARKSSKRLRRCLCIIATIFFILLLISAITILAVLLIIVGQQPARVLTSCGPVEGNYDPVNKVFSFKGIPYALPPVEDRRWRPPEPMRNQTCWMDTYKADKFQSMCAQYAPDNVVKGSEDCLYLNVFTPSVDPATPLPVMVYIHGGYLQWGDSHTDGYSPDEEVTSQLQVVFVSIQYRLNVFGFLVLEELSGRGNYGFLDQVEALRWVKGNIEGFGGDPNKVTIFGQSSGGTSVWALMMSPMARGLFSKAWIISGSPVYNQTTEQAAAANEWILDTTEVRSKCGENVTEQCLLHGLSKADILHAVYPETTDSEFPAPTWDIVKDSMDLPIKNYFEPALAVVDGEFMPAPPFEMWENKSWRGNYSDVPVIIGTTAQEIDLDPAPSSTLKSWDRADLQNYVASRLDDFGQNITNMTLALYPYTDNAVLPFVNMTSDLRMNCGNDVMAGKAAIALESPVYRYVLTSYPSREVHPMGTKWGAKYAFHMWDTYAFFSAIDLIIQGGPSQSDSAFQRLLQDEIMHFVKGDGTTKDEKWLRYPNVTALISNELSVTSAFHEEQCKFWIEKGFFGYSWIN